MIDSSRDDERRPGLVNQDTVHLIYYGVGVAPLNLLLLRQCHVVPQVIEAKFVVGTIGNVPAVYISPLVIVNLIQDRTEGKPQPLVNLAHPLRISLSQIIIHSNNVDTAAGKRIEIDRHCRRKRLPLSGLHLRNLASVKDYCADELHVIRNHFPRDRLTHYLPRFTHHAPARLLDNGKRFRQNSF